MKLCLGQAFAIVCLTWLSSAEVFGTRRRNSKGRGYRSLGVSNVFRDNLVDETGKGGKSGSYGKARKREGRAEYGECSPDENLIETPSQSPVAFGEPVVTVYRLCDSEPVDQETADEMCKHIQAGTLTTNLPSLDVHIEMIFSVNGSTSVVMERLRKLMQRSIAPELSGCIPRSNTTSSVKNTVFSVSEDATGKLCVTRNESNCF